LTVNGDGWVDGAADANGNGGSGRLVRWGMIHGRFQPFHNGHLEYLRLAAERCETLIVGITNPDPTQVAEEDTAQHRHRDDANPYTYFERARMIGEVLADEGLAQRSMIVPFPVNLPDRYRYYVPRDVTHFMRVFSDWEATKAQRLRDAGYPVEVLQPGIAKALEATEVRERMRSGEPWEPLVPAGTARVIAELEAAAAAVTR
jgi:cytidyltransferase-like protein